MSKTIKLLLVALVVSFSAQVNAQTAEEIIASYFENTGGEDNWRAIQGMKLSAKVNQGGMEIPIEIVQLKDGRQMTSISFQGKEIKQGVFDGETLWSTNFMTQKAEKSDKETTDNFKLETNDFPDVFLDYKKKGYTIELVGNEDFDGTPTFKIKLTKEPKTYDGKQEEDVSFYYFDAENFVPIAVQTEIKSGQGKGMVSEITFSDYQEVGNIYFPHTMTQGVKGQGGQPITMDKIELNPTVDDKAFMMPAEEPATTDDKKN